ncbi:Bromodomain-containing protein [Artemisia annua]|uniref:Bromodomain-containing protein n=1 Tax=Artemisia annua TaxID=35608 RepID=A0A2U1MQQ9_ARTAN|nr:Bromodomain-containing protein [Artemisia annua]
MCMTSVILDPDKISKGKSKWDDGGNNKVYARRPKKAAKNDQVLASKDVGSEKEGTLLLTNGDRGNEVVKELVVVVDGVVKIDLKAVRSKDELKELRERVKGELDKVRRLGKKLDDKEAELTAFSTVVSGGVGGDGVEGYSRSQYSGNGGVEGRGLVGMGAEMRNDFMDRRAVMPIVTDVVDRRALMRINSEMGSVTNSDMRPYQPYQQLSVSVVDNNHYGVGEFVEKEKRTPKANQYYRKSDFLLGKDRLPPETINKPKSKRGRKRKHYRESVNGGISMFKSCSNLLQRLMKHKHGWVFNEPVNVKFLGLHDYHDIIKHPMDLGTIKSRLAQNFYKSPMEFADDVRLTFHNAMTYNPKGQDVHIMAEQLSNIFEEKWAMIESESNQDWNYGMLYNASTPTPTSRPAPHFAHAPARQLYRSESVSLPSLPSTTMQKPIYAPPIRTPVPKKPKARDPNKRNMTYEEKQKLSTNLQSLPSEKLDNIVHIIKKKNPSLSQNDEEIEVDIDSVDIETLWELDRFVTNYRKSLSKNQKKAEQQVRVEAGDANRTMPENPATFVPEAPNGNQTTGAKTLAGNPTDQGNNGSRSSSSSSSSSDSGSSSSDSDSDNSSESDAGHSPRN